jgi:hypothetical protein
MADRYWVLGTGTWDSTSTTNWSDTSGGTGGFSVPTAADNVYFDANSNVLATAFTVTMANSPRVCNDFTASGLDGTMTIAGTSIGLTVSGSLTFQATNFTRTYTGTTTFNATTTGKTVTTNGVSLGAVTFDGVSGSWALGTALTGSGAITLTNGTLDLQSYTLSALRFSSTNANTRTIAFGTGQISCTGTGTVWTTATVTGLTTTGTQVVNVTSTGSTAITVSTGALSEANSISYNFTGGTYALTFLGSTSHSARNVDFTGYAGTLGATSSVFIYGNFKVSSGMTLTASGSTMTFGATSGTQQITTNTKTLDFPITFNGVGGTFQLQDALTAGTARGINLTNGTLDLFGQTFTIGGANTNDRFTINAGTKNITFNGGTLVIATSSTIAFNNAAPTGFTTTAGTGTGTISMTSASAKSFIGAGSTFNCTINQGGAGALTITGSNTFSNITNTVQPASILFTAGTTNTFSNFSLSGTSGNLITIGSVTAASHTLSKASGTVSSDYLFVSRSTATGGAAWYAGANSTDGGNNTGWSFAAAPGASSGYPYGSGHYGIGPYNIGNLVITGNVSTTAVGTLLADRSIQEDGTISTGNVGTVGLSISVEITGNAATGAVNSVLVSPIITGNAATGAVGTMGAEVITFQAITGVNGTGSVGTASNVISIGIIGVESICAVGTMIGYGWGSIPNTSESWTSISDTSESWSDLADNSVTWQEAA